MSVASPDQARPIALVFGGTFDPPHAVHVAIASRAADLLGARSILVIPAAMNPQRTATPPAPAAERLAMATIAFRHEPRARVLDLEVARGGSSYTIDTLRALDRQGEGPLRLLVGSDQALNLPSWREWRAVVGLAEPAIVLRPPHTSESFGRQLDQVYGSDAPAWRARVLAIEPVDQAATRVRAALARGELVDGLDPDVARYAIERRLYDGSPLQSPAPDTGPLGRSDR